jgi:hypothetical protein
MKRKFRVKIKIKFSSPYGLGDFMDFIRESLGPGNNHRHLVTPSFDLVKTEGLDNNGLDCYYIYSSGFACSDFFIKEILPRYEETN